jgi:hypothetical protein
MVGICGNALLGRVAPLCIHPRPVPFVFIRCTHLYSFALVQPSWSQSYTELHFPSRNLHSSSLSLQLCCKSSRFYNSILLCDVRTRRSSDTTHAAPSVRVTATTSSACQRAQPASSWCPRFERSISIRHLDLSILFVYSV